jgi:transcriptional regulator with XRE-family HTH domain
MSGHYAAGQQLTTRTLGQMLRELRGGKGVPMWKAAAGAGMDSTLLCKIELGHRLPTDEQAAALARYYEAPPEQIEAALMVEKFKREAAKNPAAAALAAAQIAESAGEYRANKGPTAGHKQAPAVNKSKKRD